ncbi:MAG: fused MFS/spermidine synthase [Candidatus Omnitrophica bacterium]|nr:fused MFS/spermidine synthase [Candidatus Omnitrophota bacterium]MDD5670371.1 fused MFS/spermidine synthase [Candidatus Omnitrophota bacterium]
MSVWKRFILLLALFVTGAVVMALEILGAKVIHPFFGVTLYVWAAMIAVTLFSLSLGYGVGGAIADRFPKAKWFFGLIAFAGILIAAIPWLAGPVMQWTGDMELRLGVFSSSLFLFALPLACLGMVSPFGLRLCLADMEKAGFTAGGVYAVSTAGSLFGTLLTAFLLVPSMPISHIFWAMTVLLMITALTGLLMFREIRAGLLWGALMIVSILLTALLCHARVGDASAAKTIYQTNTFYGQIKVVDTDNLRALLIDGSPQGFYLWDEKPDDTFQFFQYESYLSSLLIYRPDLRKILMIGLGVGRMVALFSRYDVTVDVLEIDPQIAKVNERWFESFPPPARLTFGDGRHLIRQRVRRGEKYDAVIIDAFASYDLPEHLFTVEMFGEIKEVLTAEGILGINIGGILSGKSSCVPKSVYRTLRTVYGHVQAYDVNARERVDNIVFFASDGPLTWETDRCRLTPCANQQKLVEVLKANDATPYLAGGNILTDDYNPITVWAVPIAQEYRRRVLDYFGREIMSEF